MTPTATTAVGVCPDISPLPSQWSEEWCSYEPSLFLRFSTILSLPRGRAGKVRTACGDPAMVVDVPANTAFTIVLAGGLCEYICSFLP